MTIKKNKRVTKLRLNKHITLPSRFKCIGRQEINGRFRQNKKKTKSEQRREQKKTHDQTKTKGKSGRDETKQIHIWIKKHASTRYSYTTMKQEGSPNEINKQPKKKILI